MAKAGKKNTPSRRSSKDDEARWRANQVQWAFEWANANKRGQGALADDPSQWARDATLAGAIRDALMPPVADDGDGPKVARIKKMLAERYPPDGQPPADLKPKQILKDLDLPPTMRDSLARALGKRN